MLREFDIELIMILSGSCSKLAINKITSCMKMIGLQLLFGVRVPKTTELENIYMNLLTRCIKYCRKKKIVK